ncbi:hypothetical protein B296_00015820 [Ensete ventricosum]|uniref:Uncharacterized protein n=1 Tax=Ensete ventricosum TaxID=4639 RepID=A0A426ZNA6_ENSVE|nr:hypothetical protein B296_00015820 [Ensete ventricosum]
MGAVLAGGRRCRWAPRCRSLPIWAPRYRRLPLRAGSPTSGCPPQRALAIAGHHCRGPGRDRSPLQVAWPWLPSSFLAAFVVKTEQFYIIQSHHTQFKTNLSYENLVSDTTIGKPISHAD